MFIASRSLAGVKVQRLEPGDLLLRPEPLGAGQIVLAQHGAVEVPSTVEEFL